MSPCPGTPLWRSCALALLSILASCTAVDRSHEPLGELPPGDGRLFTRLPAAVTGITFENRLTTTQELNVFTYRNFYNGGGVAAGDLTGDGLPELVFTANQTGPRLYQNLGGFRFRDVTKRSGVAFKGDGAWTTGVTMADVNGDGLLDVYVSYAGPARPELRANELYINQGVGEDSVPRFREMAAAYGVDDRGYTTQAAFLDYDRDGRLDLFVLNNSPRSVTSFAMGANDRNVADRFGGHKLYHNTGTKFEEVTKAAGIFQAEFAFGLGVVVSDLDSDGWPDIYVANDFFEKDYLYINNHDGTFRETIERRMPYISYSSMGMDIADVNNDGRPDVYTTDMLPEDDYRLKLTTVFETWEQYSTNVRNGYHHQFTRNMLHLNNGNDTFTEIGYLAGVARTDWSWGALIADFDLDGWKDLFVTNGIAKDVTSQDYLAYLGAQRTQHQLALGKPVNFKKLIDAMPSTRLPNYAFHNNGDLSFTNLSAAWGLGTPGFSSGATYADLDADGALDLVVNETDGVASVYRNNIRTLSKNRWLPVHLEGESGNRNALGARVTAWAGVDRFMQEQSPTRGFQSSVDHELTFGLAAHDTVDSLTVDWPDGRRSVLMRVAANQRLTVRQTESRPAVRAPRSIVPLLVDVTDSVALPFVHRENEFVDFDRERLMPKLLSTEGPFLAVADVNQDGLDDMFIGGAKGQPGKLLVQQPGGRFASTNEAVFREDSVSEDLGAVFFDANRDGRPDLYVVSGGSEYGQAAPALQDRLYLNRGQGRFVKAEGYLPIDEISGSRVIALDFDADGNMDLFVGGRVVPWQYGTDPHSTLLRNDGSGRFVDVTDSVAPELRRIGLVTDAAWRDVDGDGRPDLVLAGEWMALTVFRNTGQRLVRADVPGLAHSEGWWNRLIPGDFTGDGRIDFIAGNLGLNTRLTASDSQPLTMYVKDFTGRGFVQQVVCLPKRGGGGSYPLAIRDELLAVLPFLEPRVPTYESYARKTCTDLFTREELADAVVKRARTFASTLVRNEGNGAFALVPLPIEAQVAPVYGILPADIDGDGRVEVLLAGNFDGVKPNLGRFSASHGLVLRADTGGVFRAMSPLESGFVVHGQARDIQRVRSARGDLYVVTRNNDRPLVFRASRTRGTQKRPSLPRDRGRLGTNESNPDQ